jgi:hypothetical protein
MRMLPIGRRNLWRLRRAGQLVRCEVSPHPFGLELRYMVNGKPLMSRVFEEWDPLEKVARAWHDGLRLRGWTALSHHDNRLASAC